MTELIQEKDLEKLSLGEIAKLIEENKLREFELRREESSLSNRKNDLQKEKNILRAEFKKRAEKVLE